MSWNCTSEDFNFNHATLIENLSTSMRLKIPDWAIHRTFVRLFEAFGDQSSHPILKMCIAITY